MMQDSQPSPHTPAVRGRISGGGPDEGCLAHMGRGDRGRVRRELQMPEDFFDDLALVMAVMIRSDPCWHNE
jgi:hypothetical protein